MVGLGPVSALKTVAYDFSCCLCMMHSMKEYLEPASHGMSAYAHMSRMRLSTAHLDELVPFFTAVEDAVL